MLYSERARSTAGRAALNGSRHAGARLSSPLSAFAPHAAGRFACSRNGCSFPLHAQSIGWPSTLCFSLARSQNGTASRLPGPRIQPPIYPSSRSAPVSEARP